MPRPRFVHPNAGAAPPRATDRPGMASQTTHLSLLARVRDLGDHGSWREFDARYRDLVLRFCYRRGLQQSDAEDVRQIVMLNLARALRSFEYQPARGRFRGYLGRVVTNAIHRHFRSPRLEQGGLETHVASDLSGEDMTQLETHWDQEWMHHHYRLAMAQVRETADPRSVAVFERLLSGDTTNDVAEAFGMSRDAVHKVKQRLRDRLRARIQEQVRDESRV